MIATSNSSKASLFYVNSNACQNPQLCGIAQLSYNYTNPRTNKTTSYGAFVQQQGGPVTFFANTTLAIDDGLAMVTAAYSTYECQLVLIPFLDHDVSVIYECDGILNLFGIAESSSGCSEVNITAAVAGNYRR